MKPSIALDTHLTAIRAVVTRHRAANPRVFGSALRGEDGASSDIDILVDALPGRLCSISEGFKSSSKRVDLVTPLDLPRQFRERVLAEARPL